VPEDLGVRRGLLRRLSDRLLGHHEGPFLVRPTGVEVAGNRLLITDPGTHRVVAIDLEAHRVRYIPADRHRQLPSPIDVAPDLDGDGVVVTDSILGRILRFDGRGRYRGDLGTPHLLGRPTGIATDRRRGRIYVADTAGHQVFAFNDDGKVVQVIGQRGGGGGGFNFPTHLCLDAAGNLYVTDAMNFRVQVVDPDGRLVASVGSLGDGPGYFSKPKGVGVDSEGHIYVVDGLFDNVQILDRQGRPLLAFGHSGSAAGDFWLPAGIAIDGGDRIYVADSYNHRIQIFQFHPGQDEP